MSIRYTILALQVFLSYQLVSSSNPSINIWELNVRYESFQRVHFSTFLFYFAS